MNSFLKLTAKCRNEKFSPVYVNMALVHTVGPDETEKLSELVLVDGGMVYTQETPSQIIEMWQKHVRQNEVESAAKWGSNSGTFELIRQVSRR